jgi:hypothetical protein
MTLTEIIGGEVVVVFLDWFDVRNVGSRVGLGKDCSRRDRRLWWVTVDIDSIFVDGAGGSQFHEKERRKGSMSVQVVKD